MPSQNEIRTRITNRIVESLKQGRIAWRKAWTPVKDLVRTPTNFVTKRPYNGMNVLLLQMAAMERGYPISYWASFNQWKSLGAHVRKGEKAETIVFWKPVTRAVVGKDGHEREESFPILKTWSVFNVAQVEGEAVEPFKVSDNLNLPKFSDIDRTEFDRAVAETQADIRFGFNEAAYVRPPGDYIVMPHEHQFESFPAFAEVLLHEISHHSEWRVGWTGSYAEGELRAEIAACFMATELGIPNSDDLTNHFAYIQAWLQALENDPAFIFRAASAASKAADFILEPVRKVEAIEEDAVEAA